MRNQQFRLVIVALLLAGSADAQRLGDAARIRRARLDQNAAIVSNDIARVAKFWTDDVTLRRGLGHSVIGRDAYSMLFATPRTDSTVIYERKPSSVDVSSRWPLAFETGTWTGRLGSNNGPYVIGGKYSAQWVKRGDAWLIRSEVFVALDCRGAGCNSPYLEGAQTGAAQIGLEVVNAVEHLDALAREPMVVEHPDGSLFVTGYSDPNPRLWKSRDGGATWSRVNIGGDADGAIGNSDVDLAVARDGTLYFITMGFDRSVGQGTHIAIGVSKDVGATWKWTMLSRTRFDDRPWVEVAGNGTAHVIWNDTSGVSYAVSRDGGVTWTERARIHDKGGSSHLAVGPGRAVAVRIAPLAASGNKVDDGVDLIAVSSDDGATWTKRSAPGERDWPSMSSRAQTTPRWVEPLAWDTAGNLYSFWTNRQGLWLARSQDGATWTTWRMGEATDAFYPYLVANAPGQLAATWFAGRGDSLHANVAVFDITGDTPRTRVLSPPLVPDSWGLASRRENPTLRSPAGEYVPIVFLRDGTLAVVAPIQNERAQRFGFTWWRISAR